MILVVSFFCSKLAEFLHVAFISVEEHVAIANNQFHD